MPMKTYQILLRERVNITELNLMSPHQMTLVSPVGTDDNGEAAGSALSICTDQAGMIGMLRHLHNLGLEILSMAVQSEMMLDETERKTE